MTCRDTLCEEVWLAGPDPRVEHFPKLSYCRLVQMPLVGIDFELSHVPVCDFRIRWVIRPRNVETFD